MDLPLSWHTDLAVLRLGGSEVEERSDHLVVRTPANPLYHWGNLLLVTDPDPVDDAQLWVDNFEKEFPEARHRSVAIVREPADEAAWTSFCLTVEHHEVGANDLRPEL